MRSLLPCLLLVSFVFCALPARSQEKHLPLPKRSGYTPVQQLNHDGVKALEKHNLAKAKRLFYKAYLSLEFAPQDPELDRRMAAAAEKMRKNN